MLVVCRRRAGLIFWRKNLSMAQIFVGVDVALGCGLVFAASRLTGRFGDVLAGLLRIVRLRE